ncbi:MAG: glucose-1-phosphate adenylyltransferase [Gammaproteobacteria bacterium]|nr:MAG: glucose-1-phosphate adenylyltransferase [Gammaproteobacteria bacterium]
MTEQILCVMLAYGEGRELEPLTRRRPKAAVPFGGNYRVIDFPLSNCLRSGIRRILVLTQYRSHSLHKHLRDGWSIFNPELDEFVTAVPPQGHNGGHGYRGGADALHQTIDLIERNSDREVLVLSGAQIYRMDYAAMAAFHREQGAEVTLACIRCREDEQLPPVPGVEMDAGGRIRSLTPPGEGDRWRFMEIALFERDLLVEALRRDAADPGSGHDLSGDLIPALVREHRVMGYEFGAASGRVTPDRYWQKLCSLDDYYRSNMDLLRTDSPLEMYQPDWPIRSYRSQTPPARTVPGHSSNEGLFVNSMVAGGTVIAGGGVNHSILFPNVFVDDGGIVEDAILFPGVRVGEGARLHHCIVEEDVVIPAGEQIGVDPERDRERFLVTEGGVVVVTADSFGGEE